MAFDFITSQSGVDALLPKLMEKKNWGFDTETTGLDAHKDKVTLISIGRPEHQYVIDSRKVSIEPLRPFLESREHNKLGHNIKFDYKMMKGTHGIDLESVRCTMIGDKLYNNGRKFHGFALDDLLQNHLGVSVDKTLQKSFIGHTGDFSAAQLEYAATDSAHLLDLALELTKKINADSLQHVWYLENQVIPCFGDMEFAGCYLDVEGWKKQMAAGLEAANKAKGEIDIVAKELLCQVDLFGEVAMNYRSPDQCLDLLRRMRIKIKQEDRDGNIIELPVLDTSDATLMQLQDYPVIRSLQDYRSYMTRLSAFGQSFIDAIKPETGRIHFEVDQLGTETGRPAKHSKSKWNPLNIPKENSFRNCFLAPPDYLAETHDFSGCELRIWAEISGDPGLMEAFARGIDVHCYVASKLFQRDVPKKGPGSELRTPVKSLNFGIAYGMGPKKLYLKLNGEGYKITYKKARELYYQYCDEFKTGVDFLREAGRRAAREGVLYNLNGRRRYWILPDYRDAQKYPNGKEDPAFLGRMGGIEREGGNFLIQSMNAEMTKAAMVKIRDEKKKCGTRTEFFNQVYDEIVTFTHKDDSPAFAVKKKQFMIDAAHTWMSKVPMDVDAHIEPYWTK